ncbi:hypothetical protein CFR72_03420 [Gluconacetobacter entanii]|uniref:Uncharacterized protein n=1 Tax=Gluconacetobacter entanii TaxID=108528 RepID=A0A318Q5I1_9PROT|nr:hypothetical protein CFR72_03420 [Gluconacetobacter entanii]
MQGVNEKGRRGINIRDEASVSVHDNSLIIEQNTKKYAGVEIKDKSFLHAVQNAPNIVMAECDDDGFEIFRKVKLVS